VRPVLKSGLRRAWRDESTLQIGLDPDRSLVLAGVEPSVSAVLASLDGTRDRQEVLDAACRGGGDEPAARRLLDLLGRHRLLDDAGRDTTTLFALGTEERQRLGPDLRSLSLLTGADDGGLDALERRRHATVEVRGAGRVGSALASLLAASGVGNVHVEDPRRAGHEHRSPAGPAPEDVGASRAEATRRAMRRASAAVRTAPPAADTPVDLVVLAPDGFVDAPTRDALVRQGTTHLYAGVRETVGVVGPLVLPGRSSCLRCHDLSRQDRDPAWARVTTQLAPSGGQPACDTVLATVVAGLASLQVLAHLDGGRPVDAVDGTLEISLADGRLRRRSWAAHPACGCRWPSHQAGPLAPTTPSGGPAAGARQVACAAVSVPGMP